MSVKMEDLVFWILVFAVLGIVLWLLHGSPTLEDALLSITVLLLSSEFLLWKKYYRVDKNTAVSFMRFKKDLEQLQLGQEEMIPPTRAPLPAATKLLPQPSSSSHRKKQPLQNIVQRTKNYLNHFLLLFSKRDAKCGDFIPFSTTCSVLY